MTVSDDSADDTYASIYESSRGGTGSDTYAQIEPRGIRSSQVSSGIDKVAGVPNAASPPPSGKSPVDPSPPAPPSVDSLRHVVHSRQGSYLPFSFV